MCGKKKKFEKAKEAGPAGVVARHELKKNKSKKIDKFYNLKINYGRNF